jgi:hypothetical protein
MAVSQASGIEPPWSGNTPVANCRHIQYGKKLKGVLIAISDNQRNLRPYLLLELKCVSPISFNADGAAVYDPTVLIAKKGELTIFE